MTDKELSYLSSTKPADVVRFLDTIIEDFDTDWLPNNWDWTDVDGESYVPPVVDQKACGSCYAIAFQHMLESRLRVQSGNKSQPRLSLQYLLSCSFYTESCDGGDTSLLGKFTKEFDIFPESCFPLDYESNPECSSMCDTSELEEKWSVKSHGYLGGYYGAGDESLMMKELRVRGPFVVSFQPTMEFMYYKHGIYSNISIRDASDDSSASSTSMRDDGLAWEQVGHSVLLVGYGEDKTGQKFWKVQNSWSKDWGEDGFFRITRGTDECSIESIAEAAIPYRIQLEPQNSTE